jgi:hypothetical protein
MGYDKSRRGNRTETGPEVTEVSSVLGETAVESDIWERLQAEREGTIDPGEIYVT